MIVDIQNGYGENNMNLHKVFIGQAHNRLETEDFHTEHGVSYLNPYWASSPGISEFGRIIINKALNRTEKAQWGLEHAIGKHWVRRISEDSKWLIYNIYVNLDSKDYLFWKLKYE